MRNCTKCFWKTDWDDGAEQYPICERYYHRSFEEARDECTFPEPCEQFLSIEEATAIIDTLNDIPN